MKETNLAAQDDKNLPFSLEARPGAAALASELREQG